MAIEEIEDFINGADMKKNKSTKKAGRPKKENKATEQIFVNLTKEQKQGLLEKADNLGVSLSAYVKMKVFQ